jgi:class 3 adenylate cyclase
MEPQIQYVKTSDGVNIAHYAIGQGTPVVFAADPPCSHVGLEWQQPLFRAGFEGYLSHHALVRYDSRGLGMSDRDPADFSLAARVSDLEAVADAAKLDQFALIALNNSGPVAIRYAVQHPLRVTHLVLWNTVVDGRDQFRPTPQTEILTRLLQTDWEMFTENMVGLAFGWGRDDVRRYGAFLRECVDQPTFLRLYTALAQVNVSDDLPAIAVPTLVIHQSGIAPVAGGRSVAAAIPGARLVVFEGKWGENTDEYMRAVATFLGDDESLPAQDRVRSGTAIILFADIVNSTALTEHLGDTAFRTRARGLDASLRTIIRDCAGTAIDGKLLGDGVLAIFTSAREAIDAALSCATAGDASGLPLHLGVHAGDVIREGDNVYGGAVNIASRISGLSAPGEVLVSDTVRGLARTSAGVRFEDRGEHTLKGVADAQRVFAVTRER